MDGLQKINQLTNELSLLYIESNEYIRNETIKLINSFFKKIDTADSAEAAYELYENNFSDNAEHYDIIIVDLHLPGMNAFELSRKIRELKNKQIIAITANHTDSDYFLDALDAGIDKCILKPIPDKNTITSAIIDLARKAKLHKEIEVKEFLLQQKNKIINEYVYMTTSDKNGKILDISDSYLKFTGYKREEVIGKNHNIFRNHDLDKKIIKNLWDTIVNDKVWTGELKNNKSSGEEYWIKTTITPLFDKENNKIGYTSIKKDITNEKRLEELATKDPLTLLYNKRHFDFFIKRELKRSIWKKETFALLLVSIDSLKEYKDTYGNSETDKVILKISNKLNSELIPKDAFIFKISRSKFAITLTDTNDIYVKNIAKNIISSVDELKIINTQSRLSRYFTLSVGAVNLDTQEYSINSDDLYNIVDTNLAKAKNNTQTRFVMDINYDDVKNLENTDNITKLPNRAALVHDLTLLKSEAMLIILHINQLNSLKDLYGFDFATEVIIKKSTQLQEVIKDEEVTLYNLNLQEFAIFITDKNLFEKYILLLKHSILMDNEPFEDSKYKNIVANFTAGIAYGVQNIFNHADIVLQEAIISKIKYKTYTNNQSAKQLQEDNLNRLNVYKNALNNGNIVPYFQPIVDATTARIIKYEALARLITEDGEIISPYYFLDSAKEDKTFEYFTRQMLQKVFNVFGDNDVNISVNLTYENISSESMVSYIKNRLDKYGGEGITFEIVESEDIVDYDVIEKFIVLVKEYGCKVSIDDFGSGYSNFTNIIQLNIDYIKLDGSLIEKLNVDENVKHMIIGLIVYAKNANIKTIAEFVSSKELADSIRELGIDYAQGYFYGEPRSPDGYRLI